VREKDCVCAPEYYWLSMIQAYFFSQSFLQVLQIIFLRISRFKTIGFFLAIPLLCDSSFPLQSASFLFSEHNKSVVLSFLSQLLMSYKIMFHP
jgi:hypothetical protein